MVGGIFSVDYMISKQTIEYIVEFLVGKELMPRFEWHDSGWFENPRLPELPLREFQGMPVLFWKGNKPDFVASTYFLMSRYEELLNKERDAHGRFPGKASIPYKAGFIDRPIIDEYARYLKQSLGGTVTEGRITKLWLTHDVDLPFEKRGLIGRIRDVVGILRRQHQLTFQPIWEYVCGRSNPDCFDWILEFDASSRRDSELPVEAVYFILAREDGSSRDNWYLDDRRWPGLLDRFRKYGVALGLHASYAAGGDMASVSEDVLRLETSGVLKPLEPNGRRLNRHHFLRMTDPADFRFLEEAGFTDDFSVGYADVVGFRVGTCRPYRWINPRNGLVGKLVVHPMTIMECTLDAYMGLSREQSFAYCEKMISRVAEHRGECVLLWHNPSLCPIPGNWQRELYVYCSEISAKGGWVQ